jgi:aldehyde:ferredoxin oxidoreductase
LAKGYCGKILRIALNTKTIETVEINEALMRKYMGGKGLIAHYMNQRLEESVKDAVESNDMYFMTGVMSGIPNAGTSRLVIGAFSPLTGGFGISESGGFISTELKKAGWDGIILSGESEKPVYIYVNDDDVEIIDASHLWGKGVGETNELIKKEKDNPLLKLSQIGQAGENQIPYACVINDMKHACGRNGMGAVMGSKNVKAIAVSGKNKIQFDNPGNITDISKWYSGYFKDNPLSNSLYLYGTGATVIPNDKAGILPTRNFRDGSFEGAEKLSGEAMAETILIRRDGCFACPVRCKRVVEVNREDLNVNPKFGGPEYETIGAMGSLCGIDNLEMVSKAHEICNDLGIDTISTGVSIAFAMECFEKGILNKKDTDGMDLTFGNEQALLDMIYKIANREGLGELLSKGTREASRILGKGSQEFAMNVKGQEMAMHDPRGKVAVGLGYSLSPTGADHMQAAHDTMFTSEGPILDSAKPLGILKPLGATEYGRGSFPIEKLMELLKSATGWDVTPEEAMEIGERGINMARLINYELGVDLSKENLPERLYQPLENGSKKGVSMDREKFKEMKDHYFKIMGWDESGRPMKSTIEKLGL